jgi:hypothetical protein
MTPRQNDQMIRIREALMTVFKRDEFIKSHKIPDLSITSLLLLQFFLKHYYDKRSGTFNPIDGYNVLVHPNHAFFAINFVKFLSEVNVSISPKNPNHLYSNFNDQFGQQYYQGVIHSVPGELIYIDSISVLMTRFNWDINIHKIDLQQLENLEMRRFYKRYSLAAFTNIWKQLTIDDCVEFTAQNVSKLVSQKLNVSQEVLEFFRNRLEIFTLAQMFKIIYNCSGYALRTIQESGMDVLLYQRVLLDNLRNYTERIIKEEREVTPFGRPKYVSQSYLSKIFFRDILHNEIDPVNLIANVSSMEYSVIDNSERSDTDFEDKYDFH